MENTNTIKKNSFFNGKRFGRTLSKDFKSFFSSYTITLLSAIGVYIFGWLLGGLSMKSLDMAAGITAEARLSSILGWTALFTIIAVFVVYGRRNMPGYAIHSIMLPASTFEKFLSMLIILPIFTFIIVFAGLSLTDALLSLFPFGNFETGTVFAAEGFWKTLLDMFLSTLLLQSYFVFCNMAFKRHKIGYSILIIICAGLLFSLILGFIVSSDSAIAIQIMDYISRVFDTIFANSDHIDPEQLGKAIGNTIRTICYCVPVLFWGLTYHKMRVLKY